MPLNHDMGRTDLEQPLLDRRSPPRNVGLRRVGRGLAPHPVRLAAALVGSAVLAWAVAVALSGNPVSRVRDRRWGHDYSDGGVKAVAARSDVDEVWLAGERGVERYQPRQGVFARPLRAGEPGGLLSDNVEDVAFGEGGGAAVVSAQGGRRALQLGQAGGGAPLWGEPHFDFSGFDGASDDILTCVAATQDDKLLLVGTDGLGLGLYLPDRRRWLEPFTKESGVLSSNTVVDVLVAHGTADACTVVVATPVALDVVGVREGRGTLARRFDVKDHLAGEPVALALAGQTIWYRTRDRGLGRLRIPSAGASATAHEVAVSERTVPGLTDASVRRLAGGDMELSTWFLANIKGQEALCRYLQKPHDIAGWLLPAQAKSEKLLCVSVDPATERMAALGSQDGLWLVRESRREGARPGSVRALGALQGENVGPKGVPVPEVALWSGQAVARMDRGGGHTLERIAADGGQRRQWRPVVAADRFPQLLSLRQITAATEAGEGRLLVGTVGEGIGEWRRDGMRFRRKYHSTAEGPLRLRDDTSLDLAFDRSTETLFQVTSDHAVEAYGPDGRRVVVPAAKAPFLPEDIATVAAEGAWFAAASDRRIARYDMRRLAWQQLPNLPSIAQLLISESHLWARTDEGALRVCSLEARSPRWKTVAQHVRTIAKTPAGVLALGGSGDGAVASQLRAYSADGEQVLFAMETGRLEAPRTGWSIAATENGQLYLLGSDDAVHLYDWDARRWERIEFPQGIRPPIAQTEASAGVLWILDSQRRLHHMAARNNQFTLSVATGVSHLTVRGNRAVVRRDSHSGPRLVAISADLEQTTLVGEAFAGRLDQLADVAILGERLVVGEGEAIGIYDWPTHHWENFALPEGRVQQLHQAGGALWAIAQAGRREKAYALEGGDLREVQHQGRPVAFSRAEPVAEGLLLMGEAGEVLACAPARPAEAVMLLAADSGGPRTLPPAEHLASVGRHLVAYADGSLYAYGPDDGVAQWYAQPFAEPVRKLLPAPSGNEALAITRQKVFEFQPASGGSDTLAARLLLETPGELGGAAVAADEAAVMVREHGRRPWQVWSVSRRDAGTGVVVGEPLGPTRPTRQVLELGGEWLRLAEDGSVAAYSLAGRAWRQDAQPPPLSEMWLLGGDVLGLGQNDQSLHRREVGAQGATWRPVPALAGQVQHAQKAGEGLLLWLTEGRLAWWQTGQTERWLVPSPGPGRPPPEAASIRTAAESGERLLLLANDRRLYAFDMVQQVWLRPLDGVDDIFVREGGGYAVARARDGTESLSGPIAFEQGAATAPPIRLDMRIRQFMASPRGVMVLAEGGEVGVLDIDARKVAPVWGAAGPDLPGGLGRFRLEGVHADGQGSVHLALQSAWNQVVVLTLDNQPLRSAARVRDGARIMRILDAAPGLVAVLEANGRRKLFDLVAGERLGEVPEDLEGPFAWRGNYYGVASGRLMELAGQEWRPSAPRFGGLPCQPRNLSGLSMAATGRHLLAKSPEGGVFFYDARAGWREVESLPKMPDAMLWRHGRELRLLDTGNGGRVFVFDEERETFQPSSQSSRGPGVGVRFSGQPPPRRLPAPQQMGDSPGHYRFVMEAPLPQGGGSANIPVALRGGYLVLDNVQAVRASAQPGSAVVSFSEPPVHVVFEVRPDQQPLLVPVSVHDRLEDALPPDAADAPPEAGAEPPEGPKEARRRAADKEAKFRDPFADRLAPHRPPSAGRFCRVGGHYLVADSSAVPYANTLSIVSPPERGAVPLVLASLPPDAAPLRAMLLREDAWLGLGDRGQLVKLSWNRGFQMSPPAVRVQGLLVHDGEAFGLDCRVRGRTEPLMAIADSGLELVAPPRGEARTIVSALATRPLRPGPAPKAQPLWQLPSTPTGAFHVRGQGAWRLQQHGDELFFERDVIEDAYPSRGYLVLETAGRTRRVFEHSGARSLAAPGAAVRELSGGHVGRVGDLPRPRRPLEGEHGFLAVEAAEHGGWRDREGRAIALRADAGGGESVPVLPAAEGAKLAHESVKHAAIIRTPMPGFGLSADSGRRQVLALATEWGVIGLAPGEGGQLPDIEFLPRLPSPHQPGRVLEHDGGLWASTQRGGALRWTAQGWREGAWPGEASLAAARRREANRLFLRSWRMVEDDAEGRAYLWRSGGEWVQARLGQRGFDFQKVLAGAERDGRLALFTRAGTRTHALPPSTGDFALRPALAAPEGPLPPLEVVQTPQGDLILRPRDRRDSRLWAAEENRWRPAELRHREAADQFDQKPLLDADGLVWHKNDRLVLRGRRTEGGAPLETAFDRRNGMFPWDEVLALGQCGDHAWLLSRIGLENLDAPGRIVPWAPRRTAEWRFADLAATMGLGALVDRDGVVRMVHREGEWQAAEEVPQDILQRVERYRQHGGVWAVRRDGAVERSAPQEEGQYLPVALAGGRWLFEEVRDLTASDGQAFFATPSGITRVPMRPGSPTGLWTRPEDVREVFAQGESVFARAAGDSRYELAREDWRDTRQTAERLRPSPRTVAQGRWRAVVPDRQPAKLGVQPAAGAEWVNAELLAHDFAFDRIHSPLLAGERELVKSTGDGILRRTLAGAAKGDFRRWAPDLNQPLELFVDPLGEVSGLFARAADGRSADIARAADLRSPWVPRDPAGNTARENAENVLCQGPRWRVRRDGRRELAIMLSAPAGDADWKQAVFLPEAGAFAMDEWTAVGAWGQGTEVLIGSKQGLEVRDTPGGGLEHLWRNLPRDARGLSVVAGIEPSANGQLAVLVGRGSASPCFRVEAADKPPDPANREFYEAAARAVAHDMDGWAVEFAPPKFPLRLEWTGQPVFLRAAEGGASRFAHNIVHTVSVVQRNRLAMGTDAGLLVLPADPGRRPPLPSITTRPFAADLESSGLSGRPLAINWLGLRPGQRALLAGDQRYPLTWEARWQENGLSVRRMGESAPDAAPVYGDDLLRVAHPRQGRLAWAYAPGLALPESAAPALSGGTFTVANLRPARHDHLQGLLGTRIGFFWLTEAGVLVMDERLRAKRLQASDEAADINLARCDGLYYDAEQRAVKARAGGHELAYDEGKRAFAKTTPPKDEGGARPRRKTLALTPLVEGSVGEDGVPALALRQADGEGVPFFHEGKPAIDRIYDMAGKPMDEGGAWRLAVASDAGLVNYQAPGFAYLGTEQTPFKPEPGAWPELRAVAMSASPDAMLATRQSGGEERVFTPQRGWHDNADFAESLFLQKATMAEVTGHWAWRRVGRGVQLELLATNVPGRPLRLGAEATGADARLFSQGKFAFDQPHAVTWTAPDSLFVATPAGLLHLDVNHEKRTAHWSATDAWAANEDGGMVPLRAWRLFHDGLTLSAWEGAMRFDQSAYAPRQWCLRQEGPFGQDGLILHQRGATWEVAGPTSASEWLDTRFSRKKWRGAWRTPAPDAPVAPLTDAAMTPVGPCFVYGDNLYMVSKLRAAWSW